MSRKLYVILALAFLLWFWLWPRIFNPQKAILINSQIQATRDQIQNYVSAMNLYKADNGVFPTTEQGLRALIELPSSTPVPLNWKGLYIKPPIVRRDPWNRDFIYLNPGNHNTTAYDLFSRGPDGIIGNQDDISNW